MADTTAGSLTDPQTVKIGSVALTGVQSISWGETRNLMQAPVADGEVYPGTPFLGSAACAGSLVFSNPVLAKAAEGLAGTLTATLKGIGGQADKSLAITLVQTGGAGQNIGKNAPGGGTVPFVFGSADGTTDPVTLT